MPGINDHVVGTCGNCGGAVTVPRAFLSVIAPVPRCERCHATPKRVFGPTLPMNPAPLREDRDWGAPWRRQRSERKST